MSALRVRRVLVIPPYGAPPHGPQSQLSIDISLAAIAQELEARGMPTPAGQGPLGAYASLAAAGGLRVFECSTCGLAGRDGRGIWGYLCRWRPICAGHRSRN